MKNTTLYALLAFVYTLFAQEAFAQVEKYVVRNEVTRQRFFYPEQEQMFRKAVDLLDASKRVEVIGEQNQSTVATHLLEVESSISQDFTINITFVDSNSTAIIRMSQQATGKVTMLTTDISSGMLAGNTVLNCSGISTKDVKHKYADIGWVKGSKYQDKVKDEVDARIKNRYAKDIVAMENDARKKMADNLTGDPAYKLFPFRLTVLEVAETDDDEAEKVIISAGTNSDISKRDRLVVYAVNERTSGKRKFEHFESIGRLKFESDHEKGGFCDVVRGKKDILAAIKAGKTLYCTPGYTPYTKRDNSSALKLAIAVQYPREATEGAQNQFYRRVRMDLSQKKGITIIEREKFDKLLRENELAKQEKFMDAKTIDAFKSLGADIILEIRIKDVVDKYNASVLNYDMNLLEVESGELQGAKAGSIGLTNGTASISPLIERGYVPAKSLVDEVLPPLITVVEITDESKGGKADEVLVIGDIEVGSFSKLNVFKKTSIEVDGEMLPRLEEIGTIAVRSAEGEGVVNCKVKDGEKEIYNAIKAGETLICTAKEGFLGKMMGKTVKLTSKLYGW